MVHPTTVERASHDRGGKVNRRRTDFASFAAANGQAATSIRTVSKLTVEVCDQPPFQNLRIEATADGFLYNMVRTIVGTLVHVGFRNRPPEWVSDVIHGKDRRLAGMTAPACGLYLVNVVYDDCAVAKPEHEHTPEE